MAWAKNGTPDTLGSDGHTMEITDLTQKTFNQFLYHWLQSGGVDSKVWKNSDTSSVYATRKSTDGATDATSASRANYDVAFGASAYDGFMVEYHCSISGEEKLSINHVVGGNTAGAANAPRRIELVGKYVPSPDADLTAIRLGDGNTPSGTDIATDSNLSAIGSN